jgi:hypothetical protein
MATEAVNNARDRKANYGDIEECSLRRMSNYRSQIQGSKKGRHHGCRLLSSPKKRISKNSLLTLFEVFIEFWYLPPKQTL